MGCGTSRRVDVIADDSHDVPKKKVEEAWTTEKEKDVKSNKGITKSTSKDMVKSIELQQSEEKPRETFIEVTEIKKEEDISLPNSLMTKSQEQTHSLFDKNPLIIPRPYSPLKPILKPPKLPTNTLSESAELLVTEPHDPPLRKSKSARFSLQSLEISPRKEHKHIKGSPRYVKSYPEILIEETSPVLERKSTPESKGTINVELNTAIVIDNGSGSMKVGYSGVTTPASVFSSVVGRPKSYVHSSPGMSIIANSPIKGGPVKENYVGNEAQVRRGILSLKHPIDRGLITDFEDMELLWNYSFVQLSANPREHPILMTEPAFCPKENRERAIQLFFETFECPAYYVGVKSALGLYSTGRTTGTVLHVGDQVTESIGIYEGSALAGVYAKCNFSGRDITDTMLYLANGTLVASTEREIMREIKEKHGYIALDYATEEKLDKSVSYRLPDDNFITVGNERFKACEGLFKPEVVGLAPTENSIVNLLQNSLAHVDESIKDTLYDNIVVTGGTAMLPGFSERLVKELHDVSPHKYKVHTVPTPNLSAWRGGSILAELSTFNQMAISRENYLEVGPSIVRTLF